MTKLHEVLAAEATVTKSWTTLLAETLAKLGKPQFFEGESVTLKMLEESEANKAIEAAAKVSKAMPTNVYDTFKYALGFYGKAEDVQVQKNRTNAIAKADVMLGGKVIFTDLPIDQLLGLETRLKQVRELFLAIPTWDAGRKWVYDKDQGCWVGEEEVTTKTEKIMVPVVLSPATDKHPAQVKESTKDNTIGRFVRIKRSGAASADQKAKAITLVDELLSEVKMARQRANDIQVVDAKIGDKLVEILLDPLKNTA